MGNFFLIVVSNQNMKTYFDILKLWLWALALGIGLPLAAIWFAFMVISDACPKKRLSGN